VGGDEVGAGEEERVSACGRVFGLDINAGAAERALETGGPGLVSLPLACVPWFSSNLDPYGLCRSHAGTGKTAK
jgi:hypothetical protein